MKRTWFNMVLSQVVLQGAVLFVWPSTGAWSMDSPAMHLLSFRVQPLTSNVNWGCCICYSPWLILLREPQSLTFFGTILLLPLIVVWKIKLQTTLLKTCKFFSVCLRSSEHSCLHFWDFKSKAYCIRLNMAINFILCCYLITANK